MEMLNTLPDRELLARIVSLVARERGVTADVIEHLVEIDRRRLYLDEACASLTAYCVERLGYSEDEAFKRVRVARQARRFPELLEALRSGAIHLTGLFLLAPYLSPDNVASLLAAAQHKTRRQIEQLIAARFPKPDLPERVDAIPEQVNLPAPLAAGYVASSQHAADSTAASIVRGEPASPTSSPAPSRVAPLSATRFAVQFTASVELRDKIQLACELTSHALPAGDLASLFERALDVLIAKESKQHARASRHVTPRRVAAGSRHIPAAVEREVWRRDGGQCTYRDTQGRRCSARRFLTIEHRAPHARGGAPTLENLCLLCKAHNLGAARSVFGAAHVEHKAALTRTHRALRRMGFGEDETRRALREFDSHAIDPNAETLLRAALRRLTPNTS